jgi:myosin heavy subunit
MGGANAVQTTSVFAKKNTRRSSLTIASKTKKAVFASVVKTEMDKLHQVLRQTEISFIQCIKPNRHHSPTLYDARLCQRQIQSASFFDFCRMRKEGYPTRLGCDEFYRMFAELAPDLALDANSEAPKTAEDCENIVKALLAAGVLTDDDVQVGKDKVFLKHRVRQKLTRDIRHKRLRAKGMDEHMRTMREAVEARDTVALTQVLTSSKILKEMEEGGDDEVIQARKLLERLGTQQIAADALEAAIEAGELEELKQAVAVAEEEIAKDPDLEWEALFVAKELVKELEEEAKQPSLTPEQVAQFDTDLARAKSLKGYLAGVGGGDSEQTKRSVQDLDTAIAKSTQKKNSLQDLEMLHGAVVIAEEVLDHHKEVVRAKKLFEVVGDYVKLEEAIGNWQADQSSKSLWSTLREVIAAADALVVQRDTDFERAKQFMEEEGAYFSSQPKLRKDLEDAIAAGEWLTLKAAMVAAEEVFAVEAKKEKSEAAVKAAETKKRAVDTLAAAKLAKEKREAEAEAEAARLAAAANTKADKEGVEAVAAAKEEDKAPGKKTAFVTARDLTGLGRPSGGKLKTKGFQGRRRRTEMSNTMMQAQSLLNQAGALEQKQVSPIDSLLIH